MDDECAGFSVIDASRGTEAKLAMESLWLTGRILPVGARLVVVHTFRSAETEPIEMVYAFGLPRDAALRRFKVMGEGFQVRSDLKPVAKAVEDYEQGIQKGSLSSLARVYRDGRVNLSVGNLRPGEWVKVFLELVAGVDLGARGLRFRFPFTLAPCYHAQARTAAVEPGVGELELPEDAFGDVLLPRYLEDAGSLHQVGFDLSVAFPGPVREVSSPSHALSISGAGTTQVRVSLARESDLPNRDLVLDVRSSEPAAGCFGGVCDGGQSCFVAVVPPERFGKPGVTERSVVFVLDHSGSMQGIPLEQAKNAVRACLGALSAQDRFAIVAFDDKCEVFPKPGLLRRLLEADADERAGAEAFLEGIEARGGTELGQAIREAARFLPRGAGDLFVVTDGQVAGTEDILTLARKQGFRLHCLGIGSASQDRFLTLLSRQTGGVSRFVTPRERVDVQAIELFASSGAPLATHLRVDLEDIPDGKLVIPPADQVFQHMPLVVHGQARGSGQGRLRLRWGEGKPGQQLGVDLAIKPHRDAEIVRLLQGARLITDLETKLAEEPGIARILKREDRRIQAKLEELGRLYGLANRAMALVAVVERPEDDPTALPRTEVVPVGMPEDTAFGAYFRASQTRRFGGSAGTCGPEYTLGDRSMLAQLFRKSRARLSVASYGDTAMCGTLRAAEETLLCFDAERGAEPPAFPRLYDENFLVRRAAGIEPDGGVGGGTDEERLLRSAALLLSFLCSDNTIHRGPFRMHVQRLLDFLEPRLAQLPSGDGRKLVENLLARAKADKPLPPAPLFEVGMEFAQCELADWPEAWAEFVQRVVLPRESGAIAGA